MVRQAGPRAIPGHSSSGSSRFIRAWPAMATLIGALVAAGASPVPSVGPAAPGTSHSPDVVASASVTPCASPRDVSASDGPAPASEVPGIPSASASAAADPCLAAPVTSSPEPTTSVSTQTAAATPASPDDRHSDTLRLRLKRVDHRPQHTQVGGVQPARPVLRPEQCVPPHDDRVRPAVSEGQDHQGRHPPRGLRLLEVPQAGPGRTGRGRVHAGRPVRLGHPARDVRPGVPQAAAAAGGLLSLGRLRPRLRVQDRHAGDSGSSMSCAWACCPRTCR